MLLAKAGSLRDTVTPAIHVVNKLGHNWSFHGLVLQVLEWVIIWLHVREDLGHFLLFVLARFLQKTWQDALL